MCVCVTVYVCILTAATAALVCVRQALAQLCCTHRPWEIHCNAIIQGCSQPITGICVCVCVSTLSVAHVFLLLAHLQKNSFFELVFYMMIKALAMRKLHSPWLGFKGPESYSGLNQPGDDV